MFFFSKHLFLIEGKSLYNIVLASVIYQHESAIGIHMSPPFWFSFPPPTPSHHVSISPFSMSASWSVVFFNSISLSQSHKSKLMAGKEVPDFFLEGTEIEGRLVGLGRRWCRGKTLPCHFAAPPNTHTCTHTTYPHLKTFPFFSIQDMHFLVNTENLLHTLVSTKTLPFW